MSSEPVIEAVDLASGYSDRTIWSDASFTIEAGEFIAVLGPNGAGKSTLLKLLLGLISPIGGDIKVLGQPPRRGNPAIGYVPQARPIDPEAAIRGLDVVGFGIDGGKWGVSLPGSHRRSVRRRVDAAIASVGAESQAQRRLGELSGGERQRLLLAQAIVGDPQILLLDEPLANLDVANQVVISQLVASLARAHNIAVLLVAHDINPLLRVADRVLFFTRGGVAIGSADEVVSSAVLSRLYGSAVEVLVDSRGRRVVVGLEDEASHAHGEADRGVRNHLTRLP